jgi:hypothetical protein
MRGVTSTSRRGPQLPETHDYLRDDALAGDAADGHGALAVASEDVDVAAVDKLLLERLHAKARDLDIKTSVVVAVVAIFIALSPAAVYSPLSPHVSLSLSLAARLSR